VNPITQDLKTKTFLALITTIVDVLPPHDSGHVDLLHPAGPTHGRANAIQGICNPVGKNCEGRTGPKERPTDSSTQPADVLRDIGNCNLNQVDWVIPPASNPTMPHIPTAPDPPGLVIINAVGYSHAPTGQRPTAHYWQDR